MMAAAGIEHRIFNLLPQEMLRAVPGVTPQALERLILETGNINEIANMDVERLDPLIGKEAARKIVGFFGRVCLRRSWFVLSGLHILHGLPGIGDCAENLVMSKISLQSTPYRIPSLYLKEGMILRVQRLNGFRNYISIPFSSIYHYFQKRNKEEK